MNTNCFNLIKILSQGKFTTEELLNYLDISIHSLKKYIQITNTFLRELQISEIKKENKYYQLNISTENIKKIFSSIKYLSPEQRYDYLLTKLLIKKFINLEMEAKILNVSRSTILRDFKKIKVDIKVYNLKLEYEIKKGLKLVGELELYFEFLCNKITKLILNIEYIPLKLYSFLSDNFLNKSRNYYNIFYSICKELNMRLGDLIFSYLFTVIIINENMKLTFTKKFSQQIKFVEKNTLFLKIMYILKNYIPLTDQTLILYLSYILYSNKNKFYYIHQSKYIFRKFILNFIKFFGITESIPRNLKQQIISQLLTSQYKYENKIIQPVDISANSDIIFIMQQIKILLNTFNLKFFYGDLLLLTLILVKVLEINILNKKIKILILNNGYNEFIITEIIKDIKMINKNIDIDIKGVFYYSYNQEEIKTKYDIIIPTNFNENKIDNIYNLNSIYIKKIIYNFCIKKTIENMKNLKHKL